MEYVSEHIFHAEDSGDLAVEVYGPEPAADRREGRQRAVHRPGVSAPRPAGGLELLWNSCILPRTSIYSPIDKTMRHKRTCVPLPIDARPVDILRCVIDTDLWWRRFAEIRLILVGRRRTPTTLMELIWCRVSDSNRRPTAYRTTSAFAAFRSWSGLSLSHGDSP